MEESEKRVEKEEEVREVREIGETEFSVTECPEEDVCIICQEVVPPKGEHTLTMGCCSTRHHFSCFRGTSWLSSGNVVTCPRCSWPSDVPQPEETTKRITEAYLTNREYRDKKEVDTELISALYKHMLTKAVNGGFRSAFKMWTTGNVEYGFRFLASNDISLDDLLSLNFGIDTVRRHVASNLEQLVSIGFNTHHLKRLEGDLHALIALYGTNIHTLRAVLGRSALTVTKIIKLKLSAQSLADLGITTQQLCLLGMTKIRIPEFDNISMQDWVNVMGLRKTPHIQLLRIKEADFSKLLKGQKVYWNYIGLKNLLGITDEDAVTFGMIEAPSSTGRKGTSSSPRRRGKKKRGPRSTRRDPEEVFEKEGGEAPGVDMAPAVGEGPPRPSPGVHYNGMVFYPPPSAPAPPFAPYAPLRAPFPGYPRTMFTGVRAKARDPPAAGSGLGLGVGKQPPKFIVGRPRITHDLKKKKAEESKKKGRGH